MQIARSERHERPNAGLFKLAQHTTCSACGKTIANDPNYVVVVYRNPVMKAPAFYYYCANCPPDYWD